MVSSTSLRNVLAFALVVAVLPAATASVYPAVCYTKTQKCCYHFHPCGTIVKRVPFTVDCSFRKCYKKCRPHCTYVKNKVPFEVCKKLRVRHGQTCKKVKEYVKHEYIWKRVCEPKYVYKRVCKTKYRYNRKKVCNKKCRRVCKKVRATCEHIKVVSYPKFCPKLKCLAFVFKGSSKEPSHIVGKKSTVVNVIKGKRTVKH